MIYLVIIILFILIKAVPLTFFEAGGSGPAIAWGIMSIIITFIPGVNHLGTRGGYKWVDERNNLNPLFVKGFFRKKVSETSKYSLWAGLKSDLLCQIMCIIHTVCLTVYYLSTKILGMDFDLYAEKGSFLFFFCIAAFKCVTHFYYMWVYTQSFRYTENEKGIWQPFSFIGRDLTWDMGPIGQSRNFLCRYEMDFQWLQKRLEKASKEKGYHFKNQNSDGKDMTSWFFMRENDSCLDILELIYCNKVTQQSMEKLNLTFSSFWEDFVGKKCKDKKVCFTFLLCTEERSKFLRETVNDTYIDQKKDRYRLAAVMDYWEPRLIIPANYTSKHRSTEYNKMRKELLSILDISEKDNCGSYPRV